MQLLPAERQTIAYEEGLLIAGLHERDGYRWYTAFKSLNGETFTSGHDLKGAIIDKVDRSSVSQLKSL